jgi:hypothetical protein
MRYGRMDLVVLVLDDVAVPDEEAGAVEGRHDARDLARVGDRRILAEPISQASGARIVPLSMLSWFMTSKRISWMWIGSASSANLCRRSAMEAASRWCACVAGSRCAVGAGKS